MYEVLTNEPSHIGWTCPQCGIPNFSSALFDLHSSSIDDTNIYSALGTLPDTPVEQDTGSNHSSSFSSPGTPQAASSPKTRAKPAKFGKPPLRVVLVNCRSIKNKKSTFHTMIDSIKPDLILGTESWLTPQHKTSEYFPQHFNTYRKDQDERDKRGRGHLHIGRQ